MGKVKELMDQAKKTKHDSLGIAHDPESLITLINMAKEKFYSKKNYLSLYAWKAAIEILGELQLDDTQKNCFTAENQCYQSARDDFISIETIFENLVHAAHLKNKTHVIPDLEKLKKELLPE